MADNKKMNIQFDKNGFGNDYKNEWRFSNKYYSASDVKKYLSSNWEVLFPDDRKRKFIRAEVYGYTCRVTYEVQSDENLNDLECSRIESRIQKLDLEIAEAVHYKYKQKEDELEKEKKDLQAKLITIKGGKILLFKYVDRTMMYNIPTPGGDITFVQYGENIRSEKEVDETYKLMLLFMSGSSNFK